MSTGQQPSHAELDAFLAEPRQAIFATNHAGNAPQLSPVWYEWQDGALYVSTSANSLKARDVALDKNVSVCVDGGSGDYRYAAMSGEVEIVPYGAQRQEEMRYRIIRKYHDSDESARAYYDASAAEENILIVLHPSRIVYKDFNS